MGIFRNLTARFSGASKDNAEPAEISRKLQDFLQNQIDALDKEGHRVFFNAITIGYVSHLIMMITKKPVNLEIVNHALINIFTDKDSLSMIDNALWLFDSDSEIEQKLAALFPIAKKEYEAGSGEFLIRHTRKGRKAIEDLFKSRPRKRASDFQPWSAKDLA